MKIKVTKDKVCIIDKEQIHKGEYLVTQCHFEFSEEYEGLSNVANFKIKGTNESYDRDIVRNQCEIPHEVLNNQYDTVQLGVYGQYIEDGELKIRYSPCYDEFPVSCGSYNENGKKPEIITPSQYEIYSSELNKSLGEIDDRLEVVEQTGKNVQEIGSEAKKQGDYAKKQGDYAKEKGEYAKKTSDTLKSDADSGAFDGKSVEFIWEGTKLGIRLEGETEYQFTNLQGIQGVKGDTGEPFKIKKTYSSIQAMQNDFSNMEFGDYVMIASTVEEEDNAKLYTRGETEWIFITDFSGAMGIQGPVGKTPDITIGTVTTLEPNEKATVTRTGTDENPIVNFGIPKGEKGDTYQVNEEDLNNIATEITENANSKFNENVDTKTTEFNTNADNKLDEYNTNADNKLTEFNNNANSYNERITTNENNIASIDDYMYEITPKEKVKGSLVHIEDALPLPAFEVNIDGEDFQKTTKGNQLVDFGSYKAKNTTVSFADDLVTVIATGGTFNFCQYSILDIIKNNPNKVLKFGYKNVDLSNFTSSNNTIIQLYTVNGETKQYTAIVEKNDNSLKLNDYTIPSDTSLMTVAILQIFVNNSNIANNTSVIKITKPLIYFDDNNTYEEYTGNQPSPNTSYPQEIETFKGWNLFNTTFIPVDATRLTVKDKIKVDGNTNYIYSNESTDSQIYVYYFNKDDTLIRDTNSWQSLPYKFTTPANCTSITMRIRFSDDRVLEPQDIKENMLIKGLTVLPYLPFDCIGIKTTWKNLFKGNTLSHRSNNVTSTYKDVNSNEVTISGTITSTWANISAHITDMLPADTYTFSISEAQDFSVNIKGTYEDDKGFEFSIPKGSTYKTFTATKNIKDRYVYITNITKDTTISTNFKIQLENGDKHTTVEPHQERIDYIELKGNEALSGDKIVVDRKGNVDLIKNWGKVVLDGSENWRTSNFTSCDRFIIDLWLKDIALSDSVLKTTHFIHKANPGEKGYIWHNQNQLVVNFSDYNTTTLEQFKQWLSENKPVVYYLLDEPQIINLGQIDPIKTFEGTNNIEVLGTLDTEIEVEYALDIKKYTDNKLEEIKGTVVSANV